MFPFSNTLDARAATCPHCKGVAATYVKKLLLGPTEPRPCVSCGALVSMSWWSVVLVVAFPIVVILASVLLMPGISFQGSIGLTLVGAVAGLLVIDFFVPLVHRVARDQPAAPRQQQPPAAD
jgi:hypothetical protein